MGHAVQAAYKCKKAGGDGRCGPVWGKMARGWLAWQVVSAGRLGWHSRTQMEEGQGMENAAGRKHRNADRIYQSDLQSYLQASPLILLVGSWQRWSQMAITWSQDTATIISASCLPHAQIAMTWPQGHYNGWNLEDHPFNAAYTLNGCRMSVSMCIYLHWY